jgi:hypothetical protein
MNALETHVRKVSRALHDAQVCRLYKIPNDRKMVDGQLIHAEQGPGDFWGFTATGRVILLECKMCKLPSLPLGPRGLKPHQVRALREVHAAGGLALVAWQRGDVVAVFDYGFVGLVSHGRKSVPWRDLDDGKGFGFPEYLHPLTEDPLQFFSPFLRAGTPAAP